MESKKKKNVLYIVFDDLVRRDSSFTHSLISIISQSPQDLAPRNMGIMSTLSLSLSLYNLALEYRCRFPLFPHSLSLSHTHTHTHKHTHNQFNQQINLLNPVVCLKIFLSTDGLRVRPETAFRQDEDPDTTKIWNFVNHFRQAECDTKRNVRERERERDGGFVQTPP